MLFAIPMCLFVLRRGFSGLPAVLKREGKKYPWGVTMLIVLGVALILALVLYVAVGHYHYNGLHFCGSLAVHDEVERVVLSRTQRCRPADYAF